MGMRPAFSRPRPVMFKAKAKQVAFEAYAMARQMA